MTFKVIFLSLALLFALSIFGQTRSITGKVIDQDLLPVYEAGIWNVDTLLLMKTDVAGAFKLEIPVDAKTLIVGSIGMEWKNIDLRDDCSKLEIILLNMATYDFISAGKANRLRKNDFDKLTALHKTAFEKNVFMLGKPYYKDKFVPTKKVK